MVILVMPSLLLVVKDPRLVSGQSHQCTAGQLNDFPQMIVWVSNPRDEGLKSYNLVTNHLAIGTQASITYSNCMYICNDMHITLDCYYLLYFSLALHFYFIHKICTRISTFLSFIIYCIQTYKLHSKHFNERIKKRRIFYGRNQTYNYSTKG